ncbi:MAG: amino acid permease [Elusimicrobia bacterium]|nr:amino acid permease [Elusimicrobiota bacterium]
MASMTSAPAGESPRQMGLLDVTCIGVNSIVGSSVFLFPGRLAALLGPAAVLAFGLTGLLLVSVGLCFAEASTRFGRSGGPYLYARAAFGEWAGFSVGWLCWIAIMFSWAAVANAIAVYLGFFDPSLGSNAVVKGVAAAVIVTMGVINYRGVKLGAWTSDFFTAAKLLPLILFVLLGLPHVRSASFASLAPHGLKPLGSACFLAYFAFQGFEYIPVPGGEVKNPGRNLPIALIASLLLASGLYMAIQAVAIGVYPGLAGSERPLAEAAMQVMGPIGAALMVAGAVVSTSGYNSSVALVSPRYLVGMAEDGHIPGWFAALHPKFATPHNAIVVTTGIVLALALLLDFNKLVDFTNVVVCAQYLSTCVAVPLLRRQGPAPEGSFRLPGGWLVPAIGIAATAWLGAQGGLGQVWWSLGILAAGLAFKATMGRRAVA